MSKRTIKQLRADYMKIYADIPLGIRRDIIAVINDQPMSYFVCWLEIKQKTKMGEKILRYLEKLDLV